MPIFHFGCYRMKVLFSLFVHSVVYNTKILGQHVREPRSQGTQLFCMILNFGHLCLESPVKCTTRSTVLVAFLQEFADFL